MRTLTAAVTLVLGLFVFLALAPACAAPQQPVIELSPAERTLVAGQTVQLTVTRHFPGGALEDITRAKGVVYTVSSRVLAGVDENGLVTAGNETGTVLVRAVDPASDATAAASFEVLPPSIQSIDVAPAPAVVLDPGGTQKFTATAHYNNGTAKDVTEQVSWSSSDDSIATVSNDQGKRGTATAISSGDANVVATDSTTNVQGRTIVFVRGGSAQLKAIVVTPNPGVVSIGGTLGLVATGVLSDGTTVDMTATALWSTSNGAIATVDTRGIVTGVAAGQATITAGDPKAGGTLRGSAGVTVQ